MFLTIGTGKPTTIQQLANIIMNTANTKAPLECKPIPKGDSFGGYAETTQKKQLIQWKPKTQLKDGIKRYYNWVCLNNNVIPQWL